MNDYFDLVRPTYIENWPRGLLNHSVATVHFPLSPAEVDALLAYNVISLESGNMPSPEHGPVLRNLESRIDHFIKQYPRVPSCASAAAAPKTATRRTRKNTATTPGKKR